MADHAWVAEVRGWASRRSAESGRALRKSAERHGALLGLFTAGCDRLFAMGVDVVITNNVRSCIAQREARQRGRDRSLAGR